MVRAPSWYSVLLAPQILASRLEARRRTSGPYTNKQDYVYDTGQHCTFECKKVFLYHIAQTLYTRGDTMDIDVTMLGGTAIGSGKELSFASRRR